MMDINFFKTLLLAFLQSMTEFLPVSSSAHLVLSQSFGWTDQGMFSDIALHAGTLLAVLLYFSKDVHGLIKTFLGSGDAYEKRLFGNLLMATIPAIIGGYIGIEVISRLRSPIIIAGTSIIFGILLWISDKMTYTSTDLKTMTKWDALCIGLAQLLSLVPGVSRSGITITCCRALGFSRSDSTRFAMLLSIPTISASALYVLWQTAVHNIWREVFTMELLLGTLLSSIFGLIIIRFLMNWVKKSSFAVFAVYRVALGLFIIYYFLF